jgi:cysteine desulfurase
MSKEQIKQPIYMDSHATTPVDKRVIEAMLPYFTEIYGNTASTDHSFGLNASRAVEDAREQVAKLINCKAEEIIFTSGATESDNLALKGVAKKYREKGDHIITCSTEHKAILDTCVELEKEGYSVTYLPVDKYGKIDLQLLESSITDKTILISVMSANNEIGTIADISKIGAIAHKHQVLFHTDAAQAVGHIPIDVKQMNIDLMSISAHKVYGPKGVGALYCRGIGPRVRPNPIIHGGGHERGIRSGTINVPGVVGLGKALEISSKEMKKENSIFLKWTKKMYDSLCKSLGDKTAVSLNGHPSDRLSHNLNLYIQGIENKALINYLQKDVAISAGSACTTTSMEASHVILALGYTEERAYSSIRIGIGRQNTENEIDKATRLITDAVIKLQKIQ